MTVLRRVPQAVALVALLLAPGRAIAAGPTPAQALFDRGLEAYKAGRYDEACPALEQSYKLDPLPGALFTLAECETQWGHLVAATTRYDEYLRLYASLPPDKQAKQAEREKWARRQRATLETKVAELTMVLPPGAPADTHVTRDGATVPAAALGVPVLLDPGEHVITTQVPGAPPREMRLTLAPGERKGIALDAQFTSIAPPEHPAPPVAVPQRQGANKAVLIAGGTIAGASAIAGGVLTALWALRGSHAKDLAAGVPKTMPCPPGGTGATGTCADIVSTLRTQATFGDVAIATFATAGAAGIATIAYGLAAGRRAQAGALVVSPAVTAQGGGLFVGGTF